MYFSTGSTIIRIVSTGLFTCGITFAQTVPPTFQAIYNNLTTQIQTFDATVQTGWNHSPYPTLFTPQLQSVTSDNYTSLLAVNYMTNIVLPQLQQMQALGATGVTVNISFPVLYQPFYVSNPAQYQQFVSFYQNLAQVIHSRGLKMVVESQVCEPLPGNNAAVFTSYYAALSWSAFMAGRAQTAVNVAQLIQPDYMSVITEPDTEASVASQPNAGTPSGSLQLLQTILAALQAGNVTNVQIGAGAGTWTANYIQYLTNFSSTTVNFVDMHIYPINGNDFLEALSAADTIHAAGKPVAMTECWPWKVADTELGKISYVTMAARDAFSFWAPIDTSFLQAIVDFSQYKQLLFISPFWADYFSSYLDYATYGTDPNSTLITDAGQASNMALLMGVFTPTGRAWENMIIPAPDTTAPAIPAAPTAASVGTTTTQVNWIQPADNVGTAAIQVYRNNSLLETTSLFTLNDSKLTQGATYSYTLAAFDATGNISAQSAPLVVTTINTIPPPPPTNLQITTVTSTTISMSWTPSSDISGIGGYRVLRGTTPAAMSFIANLSGTTTTYTSNCRPSTTYYFSVEAYIPDMILSVPSNVVTATTPAH